MRRIKLLVIILCITFPIAMAMDDGKPAVRAPIAVPVNEAIEIKDAFNSYLMAQKELDNVVLRIKVRHQVPEDYQFSPANGRFEPPLTPTPSPKEEKKDKP